MEHLSAETGAGSSNPTMPLWRGASHSGILQRRAKHEKCWEGEGKAREYAKDFFEKLNASMCMPRVKLFQKHGEGEINKKAGQEGQLTAMSSREQQETHVFCVTSCGFNSRAQGHSGFLVIKHSKLNKTRDRLSWKEQGQNRKKKKLGGIESLDRMLMLYLEVVHP